MTDAVAEKCAVGVTDVDGVTLTVKTPVEDAEFENENAAEEDTVGDALALICVDSIAVTDTESVCAAVLQVENVKLDDADGDAFTDPLVESIAEMVDDTVPSGVTVFGPAD